MLDTITLLSILFTPLFQYKIGQMALARNKNVIFLLICLSSLILNAILTYCAFWITVANIIESGVNCATGAVAIPFMGLILMAILLSIMLWQWVNRKSYIN